LQLFCHSSIYAYWGLHWSGVPDHVPMLLAQICFAYLFDIALLWTRRGSFRWGFGNIPIVLCTNLFIWFKDDWFYWQFPLIALAFAGKELIQWNRDGVRSHIFNPSGLTLAVFSMVLLATGTSSMTYGSEIASTLGRAPHMYVWIFLLGLVVQTNFPVVLMTGSAALAIFGLTWLHTQSTGLYLFVDTTIPIAVFLGMTFLFTEPATSPRTSAGKVLFGLSYGALVVWEFQWLSHLGAPTVDRAGENLTYFDKLLQVPVLNLLVPYYDRIGRAIDLERFNFSLERLPVRIAATGAWCGLFVYMLPSLAYQHPGREVAFWEARCFPGEPQEGKTWRARFPTGNEQACKSLVAMYVEPCEAGDGAACYGLGTMNLEGAGLPVRETTGKHFFERACEHAHAPACTELGTIMIQHEALIDREAAVKLFQRACDLEDGDGCRNLATAYARGMGIDQDMDAAYRELDRALAIYRRVCDDKSTSEVSKTACDRLEETEAMAQRRGSPQPSTAPPSLPDFRSLMGTPTGDPQKDVAAMMERLRAGGMPPGMPGIPGAPAMPAPGDPNFIPPAVLMQFRVGCDAGEGNACVSVAQAIMQMPSGGENEHKAAAGYVSRACELGVARGCGLLGLHYKRGLGVPVDAAQATALFQKACRGGDTEACSVR
jgi:TPR repeat protein